MRIKTSKNVLKLLPELKTFLKFENNAQVLKFAINFSLNDENLRLEEVDEDGFEIDINVLFGEEKDYYNGLLKFKVDKDDKHTYAQVIEYGIEKLNYYIKISKNDYNSFIKKVLVDLCI